MNNRLAKIILLLASSTLFLSACGEDTSAFESPASSGDVATNDGLISQNNFTILFSEPNPAYVNLATGTFSAVTSEISVQIGDINNQLITGSNTIRFKTEWGLIEPSCVTVDGGCSVTWRSGSPDEMPDNYLNNIIAYSDSGQESFDDVDGNGLFNDGDTFDFDMDDLEEPFLNVDESFDGATGKPTFTPGDKIIDTINGLDLSGADTTHNDADGFFNGPNCSHTVLCSTTRTTATVWESGSIRLTGTSTFKVGGTVTGLSAGTLIIQNNGGDDLALTADGAFTFTEVLVPGRTYSVTVKDQPATLTCTVTSGSGTVNGEVTDVSINCT